MRTIETRQAGLAHRLRSRALRPGVTDLGLARAILDRHQRMVSELPLAELVARHAVRETGDLAGMPIVYLQPPVIDTEPAPADPRLAAPIVSVRTDATRGAFSATHGPRVARAALPPEAPSPTGNLPTPEPAGVPGYPPVPLPPLESRPNRHPALSRTEPAVPVAASAAPAADREPPEIRRAAPDPAPRLPAIRLPRPTSQAEQAEPVRSPLVLVRVEPGAPAHPEHAPPHRPLPLAGTAITPAATALDRLTAGHDHGPTGTPPPQQAPQPPQQARRPVVSSRGSAPAPGSERAIPRAVVDQVVGTVHRRFLRQLAIEAERRAVR